MEAGTIIGGKYRVVSLLGRGGMGSVWRAVHTSLEAPVAIKLIDASVAASPEALARFHREAKAAAALRSPHVVQIIDHGIDAETRQPFIAMELMEGESLADRLNRVGRLAPIELARVITQVARAVSRAHECGIVHRDLKPDNIFLVRNDDEEMAKVLDFGIAKSLSSPGLHSVTRTDGLDVKPGSVGATQTGAVMGTPYYMSPEQISSSKGVDFRSDLWALGVIGFECMTGRRPFEADTLGGLVLEICVGHRLLPSTIAAVPPGFDAWYERATAREPGARFGSARELSDALRAVCGMTSSEGNQAADSRFSAPVPAAQVRSTPALLRTETGAPFARTDAPDFRRRPQTTKWFSLAVVLAGVGTAGAIWWTRQSSIEPPSPTPSSAAPPSLPSSKDIDVQRPPPELPREATPAPDPVATVTPDPPPPSVLSAPRDTRQKVELSGGVDSGHRPAKRKSTSHDKAEVSAPPAPKSQTSVMDDVLDQRQ
ncbi:MAG TPA: protein kinase [Polyangiaceae bacterium]|nr:protein kinase [Polyangiaceae bacterium]